MKQSVILLLLFPLPVPKPPWEGYPQSVPSFPRKLDPKKVMGFVWGAGWTVRVGGGRCCWVAPNSSVSMAGSQQRAAPGARRSSGVSEKHRHRSKDRSLVRPLLPPCRQLPSLHAQVVERESKEDGLSSCSCKATSPLRA